MFHTRTVQLVMTSEWLTTKRLLNVTRAELAEVADRALTEAYAAAAPGRATEVTLVLVVERDEPAAAPACADHVRYTVAGLAD